jgi:hypothetical protein
MELAFWSPIHLVLKSFIVLISRGLFLVVWYVFHIRIDFILLILDYFPALRAPGLYIDCRGSWYSVLKFVFEDLIALCYFFQASRCVGLLFQDLM